MNLSKAYTLILLIILTLGLLAYVPLHVQASVGHPVLAVVDSRTSPSTITLATSSVSLKAGSDKVVEVDGSSTTGYLAIVFAIGTNNLVTFSGSQFDLYISKDGYSAISSDDKPYAGSFSVSDLNGPIKKVTISNPLLKGGKADFYIGKATIGGTDYKVLIGPIPFDITPDYKYIKIFDGTATSVAVSAQIVVILPAIELTPTEGPGGALVTLKGVALQPNMLVNLTYGSSGPNDQVFGQNWTTSDGKLTYSWNIKDLKKSWTDTGLVPSDTINVYVWYNKTKALIDSVTYTEYRRAFFQLKSSVDEYLSSSIYEGWGNDTLIINVYVGDTVIVAGTWWNPTAPVTFSVEGIPLGSVTPNETGFFNMTFTVPELSVGLHTVKVTNAGVTYVFKIEVLPTLVLIPRKGYVGDSVRAEAYGFPSNEKISLWWYGYGGWKNLVNATTGPDGKFNVTVTFTVPHDYGGIHIVEAWTGWYSTYGLGTYITKAKFTILPKLAVVPSMFSNDGSEVHIVGTGFDPENAYTVNIDNQYVGLNNDYYWTTPIWANATGDIDIVIIAAGFRPGLHVVSLYPEAYEPPYKPAAYALFAVKCDGDPICTTLYSLSATLENITGDLAIIKTNLGSIEAKLDELKPVIISIQEDVATIKTDVGTIKANVSVIKSIVENNNALLLEIKDDVATIKTDVGTIKADVAAIKPVITSIQGDVVTIKTDVGTIKADVVTIKSLIESSNALLTEIRDGVATIKTDVGTIKADVSAIKPVITSIQGDVATIKTDVGTIKADVAAIKPVVTSIDGNVATIKTDVGTIKGTIVTIDGNVATVKTDVGTIKADVSAVKADMPAIKGATEGIPTIATAVWLAVIFSIISAIVAIYSIVLIRRKIAG